jgi:hypothetical protein
MSTPAWKKRQRQLEHQKAKKKREYEAMLASIPKKSKKTEFKEYQPSEPTIRETPDYPSFSSTAIPASGTKKESQQYTGDYIVGIATMHKSNLVPVGRGTDPKDFATMRRN